jgi:hypothetical protein
MKKHRVESKQVRRFGLSGSGVTRHLVSFLDTKSTAVADQIWPEDMMANATHVTFARDMDTVPAVAKVRLMQKAHHVKRLAFDGCNQPPMDLLSAALAHPSLTALSFTHLRSRSYAGFGSRYFWSSDALLGHTTLRALEIHTTLPEAAVPERAFWQCHTKLEEFVWRDTMIQNRFESRAFQPMIELAGNALRRIDLDIDASEHHVSTVFHACKRLETLCLRMSVAHESESWSSETLFKRAPTTLRRLVLATAPFRDSHWLLDWEREDDTERLIVNLDDEDNEVEGMGKTQWRQIQAFLTRPARWSRMAVWVPSVTKWMSTVADGIHVRELGLKVAKPDASIEDQMKEDLFSRKTTGLQRLDLSTLAPRTVTWTSPGRVTCEDCTEEECLQWLKVVPRNCTWVELDGYERCPPVHKVLQQQPNLEVLRLAPCTIFDVVTYAYSFITPETIKGLSAPANALVPLRELSLLGRILDRQDWKTLMNACGKTIECLEVRLHIRETQPNEWLDRLDFERLDSKNLRHLTFHAHFVNRINRGEDQRGVLSYVDTVLPLVARHPRLEHLSFGCPWIHWNHDSQALLQSSSLREAILVFPSVADRQPRARIDNTLASCAALRSLVLLFPDHRWFPSEDVDRPYIRASKGFANRSVVFMSLFHYKTRNRHLLMAPPGNWISVPNVWDFMRWSAESYEIPVDPEPTVAMGPLSSIADAKDEPMVAREHAADYKDTVQRQAAQLLAGHAVELQGDNTTVTIQPDLTIQPTLDSSLLVRASLAGLQPKTTG